MAAANESPRFGDEQAPRKRGPRGTAAEKYRRDLTIFREHLEGRSAAALAREHGLSDRQIRQIASDMREAADPPRDPSPQQIIDGVIVRMEEAMRELALVEDDLTGADRLKSISVRLKALDAYFRLQQRAGRVPTEPGQFATERDIARAVEVILDVFDRYALPVAARREIRDLLDRKGGRRKPVESTRVRWR